MTAKVSALLWFQVYYWNLEVCVNGSSDIDQAHAVLRGPIMDRKTMGQAGMEAVADTHQASSIRYLPTDLLWTIDMYSEAWMELEILYEHTHTLPRLPRP